MKNLKDLTKEEYKKLDKAGMLYVLYPEATGDYEKDMYHIQYMEQLRAEMSNDNPCEDCKNGPKPSDICKTCKNYPLPINPTIKIGDWVYIREDKRVIVRITDISCENVYSFSSPSGSEYTCIITDVYSMIPAHPSEIKDCLIQEANKRGYKPFVVTAKGTLSIGSFNYNEITDTLWFKESHYRGDSIPIYKQGEWTEIIEVVKVGAYNVEFETNGIKVGCKHIDLYDLRRLKSFYMLVEQIGLSGIMMSPGNKHIVVIEKGGKSFDVDIDVLEKIIGKFDA